MPHCGICDFWRFPLNLLLCADSLLLSILPCPLVIFGVAGGEVLQHPEVICWLGFPVWLWCHQKHQVPVLGQDNALCHGCVPDRTAGQDWDLWTRQGGVGASPMRTDAVPAHFKRNAFAALLAAACVYPGSSYLSHPGAFPK